MSVCETSTSCSLTQRGLQYQFGIGSLLHRENTAVNERRVEQIYGTLLDLNRGAFADGEYEIACNLLLVALRCGQRLRNVEHLRDIERLQNMNRDSSTIIIPNLSIPIKLLTREVT